MQQTESNDWNQKNLPAKLAFSYHPVSSLTNNFMISYEVVIDAGIYEPRKILTIFFYNFNKFATVFYFNVFLKKEWLKTSMI